MRSHRTARSLLCSVVFLGALTAQRSQPRFVLPAETADYTAIAPPGHPALPLLTGNDVAVRKHRDELATLGRVLFYDRLLSSNQTRSCASCHHQKLAFADGRSRSRGFHQQTTRRNSMSIANLAFKHTGFFWDERAQTLEQMVLMPIGDPIEMGLDLATLVGRLQAEPGYRELFQRTFGYSLVTDVWIAGALAEFVRSIVSLRSRYDEGLGAAGNHESDFANFTAAENRGKDLFFGVGKDRFGNLADRRRACAMCHVERNWSPCGNVISFSAFNFQSDTSTNNGVDAASHADPGRRGVTGKDGDLGKFRAPSLRNVELTGPYMHDGRFATLEQVLEFYAHRVQPSATLDSLLGGSDSSSGWSGTPRPPENIPSIIGPKLGMQLSKQDRADLVAFLKTLTDRELLRDPRFADPFVRPDS